MTSRAVLIGFALMAILLLAACGRDDRSASTAATAAIPDDTGSGTAAAAQDDSPAQDTSAAPPRSGFGPRRTETPTIAQVTGVGECDRFLDRYRRCLQRVPEEMRSGFETALDAWHGSWQALAAHPTRRDDLAAMCTRTADNAWAAVARFNCAR